jgi:hypothetical protein
VEILIWPGVVVLLIFIFLIMFKRQISEKIKNVKQVNRGGPHCSDSFGADLRWKPPSIMPPKSLPHSLVSAG